MVHLGYIYFFGVLFYSNHFVGVCFGAVAADECEIAEEKDDPLCCHYVREHKEKEKEVEGVMKTCLSNYTDDLEEPITADLWATLEDCVSECFFNYFGLLTPDMKLDKEEIMKKYNKVNDPDWKAVDIAATKTCFDRSVSDIRETSQCKSGSYQLLKCIVRERFFNCPKKAWSESEICTNYKSLLQRCDNIIPQL